MHSSQVKQILGLRGFEDIDPQDERGAGVVGPQDGLPVKRVVFAQAVHPPLRVVPDGLRVAVGLGDQRVTLAQKSAQAAVDEAGLMARAFAAFGGFNRLVHQHIRGVGCVFLIPGQRQRHTQQGIGFRRWRAFGQLLAQGFGAAQPTQGVKSKRLHTGAQGGVHLFQCGGEGLAVPHGHQQTGCALKLPPQRDLGAGGGRGGRG